MLYQQNQEIKVRVIKEENGGSIGGSEEIEEENGEKKHTLRTFLFGSPSKQRMKRVLKTNITHALAIGRQALNFEINYRLGGLGFETGDQSYQEMQQRYVEQIQDKLNVASSMAMGALYGSWGGPIGAIAGTLGGLATTSMSIKFRDRGRARELQIKQFKQENGIAYLRARAGINDTTGRLR